MFGQRPISDHLREYERNGFFEFDHQILDIY